MMKAHVLQHVSFEGLGGIVPWLTARKAEISYTRFFESTTLPSPLGLDLIVIMGGPMSVNDEATLPWLREEKRFVRDAVQAGVPVLGVCLGAQLIASALGALVYPNAQKEIGWFPLNAEPSDKAFFCFPKQFTAFHWHGETFDLPPGAVRLAHSTACTNQAFQIGRRTLGLQFHLETTPESARALLDNCRAELLPAPYIQTEAAILTASATLYAETNALMHRVLDYLTEK